MQILKNTFRMLNFKDLNPWRHETSELHDVQKPLRCELLETAKKLPPIEQTS